MSRSRLPVFQEFIPSSTEWVEEPSYHYLLVDLPGFRKEDIKVEYEDSGHLQINGKKKVNNKKFICFDQKYKMPENAEVSETKANLADGILTITVPKKEAARKDPKAETLQENAKDKQQIDETSKISKQQPSEEYPSKEEKIEEKKEEIEEKEEKEEEIKKKGEKKEEIKKEGEKEEEIKEEGEQEEEIKEEGEQEKEIKEKGEQEEEIKEKGEKKEEIKEKGEKEEEIKEYDQKISFPEQMIRKWEQESHVTPSAMERIKENKEIVIAVAVAFSVGVLLSLKFASSKK